MNLHFLWRENYVSYLWASNVTVPAYFLHSGVLIYEHGVLSAYATPQELKAVSAQTSHLVSSPERILDLQKDFKELKVAIQALRTNFSSRTIRSATNETLWERFQELLAALREYLTIYKHTEPHYVQPIEFALLNTVRSKVREGKNAEVILAKLLANIGKSASPGIDGNLSRLLQRVATMRFEAKSLDAPLLIYADRMLREVSRRTHLALNQISNLSLSELESLLRHSKTPNLIPVNERHHRFVLDIQKTKSIVASDLSGARLRKLLAHVQSKSGATIIRGSVAYPGTVRGTIRIAPQLFGEEEFERYIMTLKKTDILVAPMTSPSLTPAFSRVAAVITDEGGLMSHAALIAREKKVPCIIGTTIATQALHEGERVIVDATNGVISKITENPQHL